MREKEEIKYIKFEIFIDEDEIFILYLVRNRGNGFCEGEEI